MFFLQISLNCSSFFFILFFFVTLVFLKSSNRFTVVTFVTSSYYKPFIEFHMQNCVTFVTSICNKRDNPLALAAELSLIFIHN